MLDLRALVRDPGSSIPLWSGQRWDVQTVNGERVMNLEHPIEKDYQKFLYYQIESLLQRDSVKALVTSIEEHAVVREALCLKANEVQQELTRDYLLPMTAEVLTREDAGDQIAKAIDKIFDELDAAVREPMYTVKYFAPLRHFSCTEDELELTDGIYIRRLARVDSVAHGVEQAFRPAVKLIKKSALAAEVPDPGCLERKDAPNCMGTPPASGPGTALLDSARCSL